MEIKELQTIGTIPIHWHNLLQGRFVSVGDLEITGYDPKDANPPSLDSVLAEALAMIKERKPELAGYRASIRVENGWPVGVFFAEHF